MEVLLELCRSRRNASQLGRERLLRRSRAAGQCRLGHTRIARGFRLVGRQSFDRLQCAALRKLWRAPARHAGLALGLWRGWHNAGSALRSRRLGHSGERFGACRLSDVRLSLYGAFCDVSTTASRRADCTGRSSPGRLALRRPPASCLPAVLDGLALSAADIGVESVAAFLRGDVPQTRPPWLGPQPAKWLLRLYYLLDDRRLANSLVAAVADFLAPERSEVAAALGFFAGLPIGAAEVARAALAANFAMLPADFPERRAPFVPHPRVERLLRLVESRLAGPK